MIPKALVLLAHIPMWCTRYPAYVCTPRRLKWTIEEGFRSVGNFSLVPELSYNRHRLRILFPEQIALGLG
jgi:hypothetical protein